MMSDTPALRFFRNVWGLGLVAGVAVGVMLARPLTIRPVTDSADRGRWFPRAAVAFVVGAR